MFTGDWINITVGCLTVAVTLLVVGLVVWGVLYAIDSWFQPHQEALGVIDGHEFTPAHTMLTPMTVGKVTVMVPQHVPDSWSIGVRVGDKHSWMSCDQETYDGHSDGQQVTATFKSGRLTRRMYVKSVRAA